MISDKYNVDNNGENLGVMVGNNSGNISVNIERVTKMPSLISNLVKLLGNACVDEEAPTGAINMLGFRPDDKIEYNCVVIYKDIIKEYAAYYSTCENYLNAYDDSNIRGKAKILKCVHTWYLHAKGEIILQNRLLEKGEMDIVRENADKIIEKVKQHILKVVRESGEMEVTYQEDMELGIECFTCYCFMECKILEKPL